MHRIKVVTMQPLYVDSTAVDFDNWRDALNNIDYSKKIQIRRSVFERDVTFVWVHYK